MFVSNLPVSLQKVLKRGPTISNFNFLLGAGVNGFESVITPALLRRAGAFGRIGNFTVDGAVYAHPLVVPGINVAGRVVTGVIIATQNNYVCFPHGPRFRVRRLLCALTLNGEYGPTI